MSLRRIAYAILLIAADMSIAPLPAHSETVDVAGVAADDVLNLRAEPRADAPLAGALSPTAGAIEVIRRSGGWAYVKSRNQAGWAAERFLVAARTFENGKPPLSLQCVGTEPFWSLAIDSERATFRTPDKDALASDIQKIEQSRNSTIVWLVRAASGPVSSAVIEARQACSDNMSDRVFPFRVSIETRDGQLLSGCCDVKR